MTASSQERRAEVLSTAARSARAPEKVSACGAALEDGDGCDAAKGGGVKAGGRAEEAGVKTPHTGDPGRSDGASDAAASRRSAADRKASSGRRRSKGNAKRNRH